MGVEACAKRVVADTYGTSCHPFLRADVFAALGYSIDRVRCY